MAAGPGDLLSFNIKIILCLETTFYFCNILTEQRLSRWLLFAIAWNV